MIAAPRMEEAGSLVERVAAAIDERARTAPGDHLAYIEAGVLQVLAEVERALRALNATP